MSNRETPLTRRYWQETGGTLTEEFLAVPSGPNQGKWLLDGIIILGGPTVRLPASAVTVQDKDIIVIQTKAKRLGMPLLGQALFSARLMVRFNPASIKTVAVCTKGDKILEALAKEWRKSMGLTLSSMMRTTRVATQCS